MRELSHERRPRVWYAEGKVAFCFISFFNVLHNKCVITQFSPLKPLSTMSGPLARRLRSQNLRFLQAFEQPSQCGRIQCLGRRRYASEEKPSSDDFKGQLYQSTHERLQRERAEQARFAEHRDAQRAARGSAAWVTPFGRHCHHALDCEV